MIKGRLVFAAVLAGFLSLSAEATTTDAIPRKEDWWMARHTEFVEIARPGETDLLFIGDSITDYWRSDDPKKGGLEIWQKYFGDKRAANFGIHGDRTQHVLWRIQNGELAGINPKAVILLIGTNNTGLEKDRVTRRNTPPEVVAGVAAIINEIQKRLPDSKILLLALFPRGNPLRPEIQEINADLAKLDNGGTITFLDIGPKFLGADGQVLLELLPDRTHPSSKGYQVWADALQEPLQRLLQ